MNDPYEEFVGRVNLTAPIDDFLQELVGKYNLGTIIKHEPIREGYEDLNIKLTIERGTYVVKVFSKEKSRENNEGYVKGLINFFGAGIPVPKLMEANNSYLHTTKDNCACIMEFFDGKNFVGNKPGKEDIKEVTQYLAEMHKLNFKIQKNYDTWGAANLLNEFEKKKRCLAPKDLENILPIVNDFKKINFSDEAFRKCIIHGDMQKQHILKNGKNYCILDLGCMDFNAAVFDIGIFLAFFAFNFESKEEDERTLEFVLNEYQKVHAMNTCELKSIPLVIKAAYSAFILSSSHLLSSGIESQQTRSWLQTARKGMEMHKAL